MVPTVFFNTRKRVRRRGQQLVNICRDQLNRIMCLRMSAILSVLSGFFLIYRKCLTRHRPKNNFSTAKTNQLLIQPWKQALLNPPEVALLVSVAWPHLLECPLRWTPRLRIVWNRVRVEPHWLRRVWVEALQLHEQKVVWRKLQQRSIPRLNHRKTLLGI